ncbi:MAG: NnrS family protein [Rhodopseudomonas palustris]|uniref:NnrS family protein n=1 Tax=Rhodopseudomonas palustris TaxID=1076 RepID=A0A933RZY2_RHOPL|nr:NnrS family protein [Rhodopseudomonas palustris]
MNARTYEGPAFFSCGFRPFFLLGSIYAGLAILIWLPVFMGELSLVSAFIPRDWHVHEMLFGFLPAVITGFLFTAIPNWTGRLPLRGRPLMCLVALWTAGRICVTFSAGTGWLVAMLVDCSFLLLIAGAAAREIIAGRKWNNLSVVVLILALLAGNVTFHLEAHFRGAADTSIRIGIGVVVLLISLIGGRIIPSFTRNWLVKQTPGRLPVPFARFDTLSVAVGGIALGCWIVSPVAMWTGYALAGAGALHLVRLARWAGYRTGRERLLLILHVGYAFVPVGFLLNACSAFGIVPTAAGVHAWMAGAAGIMTLAVMSRASLGHTNQVLTASCATQAIYAAIIISVMARICAILAPAHSLPLLHVAAFGWAAAFLGFALSYGPTLIGFDKRTLRQPVTA